MTQQTGPERNHRHGRGDASLLAIVFVGLILLAFGSTSYSATPITAKDYAGLPTSERAASQVRLLASSRGNLFVGAVGGGGYLYVGLLNGSIEKMDPRIGLVMASVALPDRNSAAHLLYYNGSLYVGTEFLRGARNTAPYHIYRIDPQTMQIMAQMAMRYHDANGFVFAFNGYLWAGDGACTLYKIRPGTLTVVKTVPHVAEDEMTHDGVHYWTECYSKVNVLSADSALTTLATGSLPPPGRPRGFFMIGSSTYSENSADFALYQMSVSGHQVIFKNLGTFGNNSLVTRDAFLFNGLLYAYGTRDDKQVQPHVLVYDDKLRLKTAIALPGFGLPSDASQHSLFLLDGKIWFIATSSIGYFAPLDARAFSTTQPNSTTTTSTSNANTILSSPPGQPNIDRKLLIVLMVAMGLIFTVIYLKRVKATRG